MTYPRELISELRAVRAAPRRPHLPARRPRRVRPRLVGRVCDQRVEIVDWLLERVRARAPLRRLHGRRPHPPSRLAGVGGARARRAASPRSTGSSTARSASCSRRRLATGRRGTCSSSPTTAAARSRRRRQPQRLAGGEGLPRVRPRAGRRGAARSATGSSSFGEGSPRLRHRRAGVWVPRASGSTTCAATPSSTGRGRRRSRTAPSGTSSSTCAAESGGHRRPARTTTACATRSRTGCSGCGLPTAHGIVAAFTGGRISSTALSSCGFPISSSSSRSTDGSGEGTQVPDGDDLGRD